MHFILLVKFFFAFQKVKNKIYLKICKVIFSVLCVRIRSTSTFQKRLLCKKKAANSLYHIEDILEKYMNLFLPFSSTCLVNLNKMSQELINLMEFYFQTNRKVASGTKIILPSFAIFCVLEMTTPCFDLYFLMEFFI